MYGGVATCAAHPLGIRPLGNAFGCLETRNRRNASLGPLFGLLSDELIVNFLGYCDARNLCCLALCSKAFYAFSRDEDLWRGLTLSKLGSDFQFVESWRRTYVFSAGRRECEVALSDSDVSSDATGVGFPQNEHSRAFGGTENDGAGELGPRIVRATDIYSDVLFHKWRCQSACADSSWLEHDNVQRVDAGGLSVDEFRECYESPGIPVVLNGIVPKWHAWRTWSKQDFVERFKDVRFMAGGFEFPMHRYVTYSDAVVGKCDQPLYLFDKDFTRKAPQLANEYVVPKYFQEDLFKYVGDDDERPAYRWLIIGPQNSGSSFHKDPNGTSAWNACVRGSKKWILFPPDCPPPGIHPSGNESDVTAPVSVLEWFINYYHAAHETGQKIGAVECTVRAGEILFIPAGWWHIVLNLEWTVAVTQNYVSSCNFRSVAHWLQSKPSQVSGCRDEEHARRIADTFVPCVLQARPDLREALYCTGKESLKKRKTVVEESKLQTTGLWSTLSSGTTGNGEARGFMFGLD